MAQWVSFRLDNEYFAITTNNVQEIARIEPLTKLVNQADYLLGVFRLRETVVPVIDLGKKLGIENDQQQDQEMQRFIIMEKDGQWNGLLVDEVHNVTDINEENIHPPEKTSQLINHDLILGMYPLDGNEDKLITLLDAEKILHEA